jgi:hypothetical protein
VAGVEIGFWPAAPSLFGAERSGVSSVMFMVLLVTDGLAVWLVPLYRKLLGVQAAALGLLAMTTTNLGGFFVGTGAALVGGAMAFRWMQSARPADPASTRPAEPASASPAERSAERSTERAEERAVERTAELAPGLEGDIAGPGPAGVVSGTPEPGRDLAAPEPGEPAMVAVVPGNRARHEARRPRPAASSEEDELVAHARSDDRSFIPGF